MSVNKYLPHVFVLPEDDANRQMANGFHLNLSSAIRRMQVLEEAGGWQEVVNRFKNDRVPEMDRNANRFMVLLVDFDRREDRLDKVRVEIPDRLQERVFVLGAWSQPEELRQNLGSYETIGLAMAKDCRDSTQVTWTHHLLCHNAGELLRLQTQVRPILFI